MSSSRWSSFLRHPAIGLTGLFLTLLSVSPRNWWRSAEAWNDLVFSLRGLSLIAGLAFLVIWAAQNRRTQPEPAPPASKTPELVAKSPADAAMPSFRELIHQILDEAAANGGFNHTIRINMVTGHVITEHVCDVLKDYATDANWNIHVLMPDLECIGLEQLDDGAKGQAQASRDQLLAARDRLKHDRPNISLELRTTSELPTWAGAVIDHSHALLNFIAVEVIDRRDRRKKVHSQGRHIAYFRKDDQLSRHIIVSHATTFDERWAKADPSEGPPSD